MLTFFLRVAIVVLFAMTSPAFALTSNGENETPQTAQTQTKTVNINTADLETLQSLPRVGPVIAQRILDYREKNGKFESKEDLMKVSGIGEKTFARLKELISI